MRKIIKNNNLCSLIKFFFSGTLQNEITQVFLLQMNGQCLLLPGISRQQTIFLNDLRFFVQWFHGSMVQSICDCSAVQSAVCLSKCLAAAPIFLLGATRHFVLLSCKIWAEIRDRAEEGAGRALAPPLFCKNKNKLKGLVHDNAPV